MTEVINKYETVMVIDMDKTEEETQAILEKIQNLIAKNGEVEKVDVWGMRKLAYAINFKNEGFYTLIKFSAKPEFPSELDRIYRITDGVIRSIIVRRDELPQE
ncbi:MAG: 30S ribosomal protein S6 [Eubacteriales bacterium]|nr:30S ribosomal protein S6 [Eubacteriales bacterium]